MRVLIACEFSGTVRKAFEAFGHDAWSCDLLDTEIPGKHYVGDVREVLHLDWDLMIAHPPCTHLAVSGARWFKEKQTEQAEALEFVRLLMDAPIEYIAIENPISIISSRIRKPDQIIQPWQFGYGNYRDRENGEQVSRFLCHRSLPANSVGASGFLTAHVNTVATTTGNRLFQQKANHLRKRRPLNEDSF